MKLASKAVATAVLAAAALSVLAGATSAQESYAVTKYEYSHNNDVDTHGLSFGLSGRYESGFSYDLELMSTEADGFAATGGDLEMSYLFSGIAGPVALYEYRNVADVDSDQLLIGLEGATVIYGADVSSKLLFDTADQDMYRLAVGAEYAINNDFSVNSELTHFNNVGAADLNLVEVGMRYRVFGAMHADVGAHYGRADGDVVQTGLHLGLGFDF